MAVKAGWLGLQNAKLHFDPVYVTLTRDTVGYHRVKLGTPKHCASLVGASVDAEVDSRGDEPTFVLGLDAVHHLHDLVVRTATEAEKELWCEALHAAAEAQTRVAAENGIPPIALSEARELAAREAAAAQLGQAQVLHEGLVQVQSRKQLVRVVWKPMMLRLYAGGVVATYSAGEAAEQPVLSCRPHGSELVPRPRDWASASAEEQARCAHTFSLEHEGNERWHFATYAGDVRDAWLDAVRSIVLRAERAAHHAPAVIATGWLFRRHTVLSPWRRYFFAFLASRELTFSDSEFGGGRISGTIRLEGSKVRRPRYSKVGHQGAPHPQLVMELVTPSKTYVLCPEEGTDEALDRWVALLADYQYYYEELEVKVFDGGAGAAAGAAAIAEGDEEADEEAEVDPVQQLRQTVLAAAQANMQRPRSATVEAREISRRSSVAHMKLKSAISKTMIMNTLAAGASNRAANTGSAALSSWERVSGNVPAQFLSPSPQSGAVLAQQLLASADDGAAAAPPPPGSPAMLAGVARAAAAAAARAE